MESDGEIRKLANQASTHLAAIRLLDDIFDNLKPTRHKCSALETLISWCEREIQK